MESPPPSGALPSTNYNNKLESAHKIILCWDSTVSEEARDKMIFSGDRHDVDSYLKAVDEIQLSLHSLNLGGSGGSGSDRNPNIIQIAMARLKDELRNILLSHSSALDSDYLVDIPRSFSSSSYGGGGD